MQFRELPTHFAINFLTEIVAGALVGANIVHAG